MTYKSTVTSKGTITLPAEFRARLGIVSGEEVAIELHGNTIAVTPKGGWEEFFAAGQKVRKDLKKRGVVIISDPKELNRRVDEIKTREYEKKYSEAKEK